MASAAGLLIVLLVALAGLAWLIAYRIAPEFDGWRFHGRASGRSSHEGGPVAGEGPASFRAMAVPADAGAEGGAAKPRATASDMAAALAPDGGMAGADKAGAAPADGAGAAAPAAAAPMPLAGTVAETGAPATAPAALSPATAIGVPAAVGAPDDLLQLKGVGPVLNKLLMSLGVRRFDQIAGWSASDIASVDAHLGNFKGRIVRDNWVEQAGLLARGAIADFEAKFGKLDSENK